MNSFKTRYNFFLLVILCSCCLINGCIKKSSSTTSLTKSSSSSIVIGPSHVNTLTAKLNSQSWSATGAGCSVAKYNAVFLISGRMAVSDPNNSITIKLIHTTGVVNLSSIGNFQISYLDANNTNFTARTGTLNITSFDTISSSNAGIIQNLKATFSFKTDTINNVTYDVTNGIIDLVNP